MKERTKDKLISLFESIFMILFSWPLLKELNAPWWAITIWAGFCLIAGGLNDKLSYIEEYIKEQKEKEEKNNE